VAAVASTGVDFTGVDFTVAGFMGASTEVGFTGIDFTMAGSTPADFTTTGFSSVEGSLIPGGAIIRTMDITITANPTPRRLGTTVPILPAITLM
jgi:hypothetical protein